MTSIQHLPKFYPAGDYYQAFYTRNYHDTYYKQTIAEKLKAISTLRCYTSKILAPPDDKLEQKLKKARERTNNLFYSVDKVTRDEDHITLEELSGYKYHEDDFEMAPEYGDLDFKKINFTHGVTARG